MKIPEYEDLAGLVGMVFIIRSSENESFEAVLSDISDLRIEGRFRCFSIVYYAPPSTPAEPGIYLISHPDLGEFELFLSPFQADQDSVRFEAVFN